MRVNKRPRKVPIYPPPDTVDSMSMHRSRFFAASACEDTQRKGRAPDASTGERESYRYLLANAPSATFDHPDTTTAIET